MEKPSSTKIVGVTPYSQVGIAPIILFGGKKFIMVNNQGISEATERNLRLYSDKEDYLTEDGYKLMKKNLEEDAYRNIVNYLAELKNLAASGISKIDYDLPQLEIDPVSNKPKIDENNHLVYRRDRTGQILFSSYNEVNASTGIGEIFTIREYYDSGYETPYYIFKDGKPQFSTESLLTATRFIYDYAMKVLEDSHKKRGEEENTEEYFNITK